MAKKINKVNFTLAELELIDDIVYSEVMGAKMIYQLKKGNEQIKKLESLLLKVNNAKEYTKQEMVEQLSKDKNEKKKLGNS